MSQQSNVSIYDAATPQVLHTYTPHGNWVSADGAKSFAEWMDRSAATPLGYGSLRRQLTLKPNGSGLYKDRFVFELPVVETVNGVPAVTRRVSASLEFITDKASTEREVDDILTAVHSLITGSLNSAIGTDVKRREMSR